jgi:hypothetical protein
MLKFKYSELVVISSNVTVIPVSGAGEGGTEKIKLKISDVSRLSLPGYPGPSASQDEDSS